MDVQTLLEWMATRNCQLTVTGKEDYVLIQLDTKSGSKLIRRKQFVTYPMTAAFPRVRDFPLALLNGLEITMEETQAELNRSKNAESYETTSEEEDCEEETKYNADSA